MRVKERTGMGQMSGVIPAEPADHRHRLAEVILADSRRAGLRRGSRLPTERQLAVSLGVTRTSVRRALTVLEAQGRISREVGRGTFLREEPWPQHGSGADGGAADRAAPADPPHPAGEAGFAPADVMTVRRLLEPPAMRLVVAWATAADLEEIGRCLAGGERSDSYDEFESWDLALHRSIMAASHSPLLTRLYA